MAEQASGSTQPPQHDGKRLSPQRKVYCADLSVLIVGLRPVRPRISQQQSTGWQIACTIICLFIKTLSYDALVPDMCRCFWQNSSCTKLIFRCTETCLYGQHDDAACSVISRWQLDWQCFKTLRTDSVFLWSYIFEVIEYHIYRFVMLLRWWHGSRAFTFIQSFDAHIDFNHAWMCLPHKHNLALTKSVKWFFFWTCHYCDILQNNLKYHGIWSWICCISLLQHFKHNMTNVCDYMDWWEIIYNHYFHYLCFMMCSFSCWNGKHNSGQLPQLH